MSTPFVDPENPESQGPTVPAIYTNACQVRQYGVGGASTHGAGPSVLPALKNPPAAMVTAAAHARTTSVVTLNDLVDYHSVADANANGANGVVGGTP
jgi:hypothetical protein